MKKKLKKIVMWFLGSLLFALLVWAFTNHPIEVLDNTGKIIGDDLICIQTNDKTVTVFYLNLTKYEYDCSKKNLYYDLTVLEEGESLIKGKHYIIKNIRMNDIEIEKPSLFNKIFN